MRSSFAKIACTILIVLAAGYAFFSLRTAVPAWKERRGQIDLLEKRNAVLARDIEMKRERIRRLRESPSLQELEIRQRLKLVRPEEKVFILQDPKK
ncbi:MAG: septum formation initiator family protein [Bryobacteraceae bacterium]